MERIVWALGVVLFAIVYSKHRDANKSQNKKCDKREDKDKKKEKKLVFATESLKSTQTNQFSILSWNTLSKKYCHPGVYESRYKGKDVEKLDWLPRKERLHKELRTAEADIICLQEVELPSFDEDFGDFLTELGYSYQLQNRKASNFTTGNAVIYKTEKFRLTYENSRSRAFVVGLQLRADADGYGSDFSEFDSDEERQEFAGAGQTVYVVNVHLEGHPSKEHIRLSQIKSVFNKLSQYLIQEKEDISNTNIILCGDFNSTQHQSLYKLFSEGSLKAGHKDNIFSQVTVTKEDYTLMCEFLNAYEDIPNYPTFCKGTFFSTIDFIWFTPRHLANTATREVISQMDFVDLKRSGSGLPNYENPSDHLPIAAVFEFCD